MTDCKSTEFDEIIYNKLKTIANKLMSKERLNHTLSPTDLVHEAYLKISNADIDAESEPDSIEESQYFFVLARQMRRLLVDYGRHKSSLKKGSEYNNILYTDSLGINQNQMTDFSIISQAIDELDLINERCAQAIDLYYFTGITREETAKTLNVSIPTLERDLRFAKAHITQYIDENTNAG
jgi:RNA polymerase sigma-70 factor (ECF subfamily)